MKKEKTEKTKLTIVKDGEETQKEMNKPTPEEVEQFKNEFEAAVQAFTTKKWAISEIGSFGANDVGLFLLDFIDRFAFWTKQGWMGLIKMREETEKAMKLADENTALEFDWQAMEFSAYMLSNPGSIGINSALEFEKIAEKYSKILTVVGQKLEEVREERKNLEYLQERWAAGEQGFYLAELEPKEEETPEANVEEPLTEDKKDSE